jgi:hypothetical protein
VNDALVTGIISAAVAIGGTWVAYRNRNRDSADNRLKMILDANHTLVADLQTEREELQTERGDLRERVIALEADLKSLRSELHVQGRHLDGLREWITRIMRWALDAAANVRKLGGTVDDPPPPPPEPPDLPGT